MTGTSREMGYTRENMSIEEFGAIPDCPTQRNTELHFTRRARKHLCGPFRDQWRDVVAAELPDGKRYKIDGHTRCYGWMIGKLERPSNGVLDVKIHPAKDMDDVNEIYEMYDNPDTSKTSADNFFGGCREHGFFPESDLLRTGGIVSGMGYARRVTVRENSGNARESARFNAGLFMPEIKLIDGMNFNKNEFRVFVISAAIVTLVVYGEDAIGFWERFNHDAGSKYEDRMDGVQAYRSLIIKNKAKNIDGTGYNYNVLMTRSGIIAYEKDRAENLIYRGILAESKYVPSVVISKATAILRARIDAIAHNRRQMEN